MSSPADRKAAFLATAPHPLRPFPKLIINAAPTGMVPQKRDTPHVPIDADEVIEDGCRCVEAGASILHLHARDPDGAPTQRPEDFAPLLEGLRKACPEVVLCVTTSGRVYNDFERRAAVLDLAGDAKPDMASLTLSSLNFPRQASVNPPDTVHRLAERMQERGIKPELEVFDAGMINAARQLMVRGLVAPPLYFNVLFGSIYSVQARMADLAYLEGQLPPGSLWAGAGIGVFQLVVNTAAILMGGHVRVGLEDNIWYDHARTELATNGDLIRRVRRIATELQREIATPAETRAMLGIPR